MVNYSAEESIRKAAWKNKLGFTGHALKRMGERKITNDDVYNCVRYGLVAETQDHGQDIKVIFQEPTSTSAAKYVVVADSLPWPIVITVCLTIEEAWETRDGILRRRD